VFANLNDFQILCRHTNLSHVTRHAHTAHDSSGEQTLPDRAGPTTPSFRTVSCVTTAKIMALHDTFETTSLRDSDCIDEIASSENVRANRIAGLNGQTEIAEFFDAFNGCSVVLLDVAEQRLCHALLFLVVKTELDSIVSVALLSFDLNDTVWS